MLRSERAAFITFAHLWVAKILFAVGNVGRLRFAALDLLLHIIDLIFC